MVKLYRQEEIQQFLSSSGLDIDLLDESNDSFEAWQQECNLLIRRFVNYLQDRFARMERRLDTLERYMR